MTNPANQLLPIEAPRPRLGRNDPILQELWAVKAAMNSEADYQVNKIIERTRRFDLEATIARLKREVAEH